MRTKENFDDLEDTVFFEDEWERRRASVTWRTPSMGMHKMNENKGELR